MENDNMKPKTVAESIAELRDRLASIESTSANTNLTETALPSNSLQEHMHQVEQDYLFEKSLGGGILSNVWRGMKMKNKPKGAMKKDPKVPGQKRTATEQPPTPGETTAHKIGKGVTKGAIGAGGVATIGGVASGVHHADTGNWLPDWMHGDGKTNDTTDGNTDGQLDGGDPKPHTNPNYDEKTAHLQQWLLDQGADLGTTGPNGDGVDGIMGEKTRQAAKDHHVAGYEDSTPPVTPPPPVTQPNTPVTQPTTQVTPLPVTSNAPPAGNSNAEFQAIVDKFEKTFKELEGLTKGDPAAQSELEQIKRSAGY